MANQDGDRAPSVSAVVEDSSASSKPNFSQASAPMMPYPPV